MAAGNRIALRGIAGRTGKGHVLENREIPSPVGLVCVTINKLITPFLLTLPSPYSYSPQHAHPLSSFHNSGTLILWFWRRPPMLSPVNSAPLADVEISFPLGERRNRSQPIENDFPGPRWPSTKPQLAVSFGGESPLRRLPFWSKTHFLHPPDAFSEETYTDSGTGVCNPITRQFESCLPKRGFIQNRFVLKAASYCHRLAVQLRLAPAPVSNRIQLQVTSIGRELREGPDGVEVFVAYVRLWSPHRAVGGDCVDWGKIDRPRLPVCAESNDSIQMYKARHRPFT